MPEVWGEDAAVFNPYRWFKENGESISYSTFSKPRAALEGQIMISRLLIAMMCRIPLLECRAA
jgi:hypothetical protein